MERIENFSVVFVCVFSQANGDLSKGTSAGCLLNKSAAGRGVIECAGKDFVC